MIASCCPRNAIFLLIPARKYVLIWIIRPGSALHDHLQIWHLNCSSFEVTGRNTTFCILQCLVKLSTDWLSDNYTVVVLVAKLPHNLPWLIRLELLRGESVHSQYTSIPLGRLQALCLSFKVKVSFLSKSLYPSRMSFLQIVQL